MNSAVSQIVTNTIIRLIDGGTLPWRSQYFSLDKCNYNRQTPYSTLNQLILSESPDRFYLTEKEIKNMNKKHKAGCHKRIITFWKVYEKKTGSTGPDGLPLVETIPVLKFYNVMGVSDIVDFTPDIVPLDLPERRPVDEFIKRVGATIQVGGNHTTTVYFPIADVIVTPPFAAFPKIDYWYGSLFRALIDWTGGHQRLPHRDPVQEEEFGMESLIREIGSAMLMKAYNLEWEDLAPAAIQRQLAGWKESLSKRNDLIVTAASRAEKAVTFLRISNGEPSNIFDLLRGL